MNKHTVIIQPEQNQIDVLDLIKTELKKDSTSVILIDLTHVHFQLTRDFLFVISQRFHRDRIILGLGHEKDISMAKSLGLQAEVISFMGDFEKGIDRKNILAHNMSMWEYFLYEIRRGYGYIRFYSGHFF